MKVELRIHTVLILQSILKAPGGAKDIAQIYRAGKLIVETLKVPSGLSEAEQEEIVPIELEPDDIKLVKASLENVLEKGILSPTEWLYELITKLELIPKT